MHKASQGECPVRGVAVAFLLATLITVILATHSLPIAHADLDGTMGMTPAQYISPSDDGFVLVQLDLNNQSGPSYNNSLISLRLTFANVSNFNVTQIGEIAIFNESGDAPGFSALDVRVDNNIPVMSPGDDYSNWTMEFYDGITIPSYPENATFYVVILDGSGLVEDAAFNVSIESGALTSEWGTLPATTLYSTNITVDGQPPVASFDASTSPFVSQGTTVNFFSTATDDETITQRLWDLDGDGTFESSGSNVGMTYNVPGVYNVAHNVTDGAGNTDQTSWTLTVNDTESPVSSFTFTPSSPVDEDVEITFNASASTDNVNISSYQWDFQNDGIYDDTGKWANHTFTEPGDFTIVLNVTDSSGNWDESTQPITIMDTTPPDADFVIENGTYVDEDTLVVFNASVTTDNGPIDNYVWDFQGDGMVDDVGMVTSFTFANPGTYNVTLNVTDEGDNWAIRIIVLTVNDTTPPTAAFTISGGTTINEDVQTTFNASSSSDNDVIATYLWDLNGDGINDEMGMSVQHAYAQPGMYNVTLTVVDEAGNEDQLLRTLTVRDTNDPVAAISTNWGNETDEDVMRTFSGAASSDNWDIVNYSWDMESDGTYDLFGQEVEHAFYQPGTYSVSLKVSDPQGNENTTIFEVTAYDVTSPEAVIAGAYMSSGTPYQGLYAGRIVVEVHATDNVDISEVALYADAIQPSSHLNATATPESGNTYVMTFDSASLQDGEHQLLVTVTDISGNENATPPSAIAFDNTPPKIFHAYAGSTSVQGDVTYFAEGAQIIVSGTDALSGLSRLSIETTANILEENATAEGAGSIALNPVLLPFQETTLTMTATDELGNHNTTVIPVSQDILGTTQLYPDATAPSVVITHVNEDDEEVVLDPQQMPADGLSFSVKDHFVFEGNDTGSGIATIYAEIGYPQEQVREMSNGGSLRVHLGATHLSCWAEDELGNLGPTTQIPLNVDFHGGIEVKTDMMIFGWTEPSGGGYITWTLSGDLAVDLRNQIIEGYDDDLPGMPGYGRIDEDEANLYLANLEQSTNYPSLENPESNNLDRRLVYWGAETTRYDPKYGGSDTGHDLRQSVMGLIDYTFDQEGPITIEFQYSAEYLAGRQVPELVEPFIINVLFSPFQTGYQYDGPVSYKHQEVMVGLPAFYNADVVDGEIFMLRTPIGEVAWYSVEYSDEPTQDRMETQDFYFMESPLILFLITLVGAYLTNYLPNKFYADFRSNVPRRLRPRAKRIKAIHIVSVVLLLLLVALYLVPTPFVLFGSNFFFSGYILIILAAMVPLIMGLTAFFLYKNKKEDLLGIRKKDEEEDETPGGPVPDYPVQTRTVATAPPPKTPEKEPLPKCDICLGTIEKGMSSLKCKCGANFHYPCIKRVGDCPVCDTTIFKKDEPPAPPPAKAVEPEDEPEEEEVEDKESIEDQEVPEEEIEMPEETTMPMVKATCTICNETMEHPEGADPMAVKCPACGTILKNIQRGYNHLVLSEVPTPAYDMFVSVTRKDVPGMVISSTFPTKITRQFKLSEDTILYWLTYTASSHNTLDPKRLDFETTRAISTFVKNNRGPVILLDGLEYLVVENTFEKILKFIKKINDIASAHEATFIVAVNKDSLPIDQLTILKKEFDHVTTVTEPEE